MHTWLATWGLTAWKPALTALLLPPVPWILLVLWGAWGLSRRQRAAWGWMVLACVGLWASSSSKVGTALSQVLLSPPAALQSEQRLTLQREATQQPGSVAIVVLGGGREPWAPEYDAPNLNRWSLERLRYGVWLSKQTGAPLAFSGGVGHAGSPGMSEAEVATHIAANEFQHPLRWTERDSRDTRENAQRSVPLLRAAGVRHIVIVTHGWHMPRSLRAFEQAVAATGGGMALSAAPMGLAYDEPTFVSQWLPSAEGMARVRHVLREWLGLLAGA